MSDTLRKVKSGDPFKMPAATFNAFVDAARGHRDRQHASGQQPKPTERHSGIVQVRNDSGSDRDRFDVLGIASPIFSPAIDVDAFKNQPAISCVTPAADHVGKFVILLEPLAAGSIGRAMAAGVCPAKIDITDTNHGYADAADGQTGNLDSSSSGAAQILWAESGTGVKWTLVRWGAASGGSTDSAKILGGSGETADTESWDITNQGSNNGVLFNPHRLYWSGVATEPVYEFRRYALHDSAGRLTFVGPEVRTTAFSTGPCQEG